MKDIKEERKARLIRKKLRDPTFLFALSKFLNHHSIDNLLDTPDFLLAEIVGVLLETYSALNSIGIDKNALLKRLLKDAAP